MKKIIVFICLHTLIFASEQSGSFIDVKHHLEWQDTADVEKEEKWAMSKSYCHSLKLLGYNDWHLPTIEELKTIIETVQTKKFNYGTSSAYWTSEDDKKDYINAWAIYMQTGHLFSNDKCDIINTRCVRNNFEK